MAISLAFTWRKVSGLIGNNKEDLWPAGITGFDLSKWVGNGLQKNSALGTARPRMNLNRMMDAIPPLRDY